ncbi:hypothetical protein NDU88_002413 [Pleurodeles waltl]|uniref:Uncharacterized protein n=1 Tax=Pleurodeles waltl TaxID=8319 RepID=A0AAV7TL20_PLEWA|nr:hypothetical protein NDU88_002413 [Pleurodeles waltl]
MSSVCLRGPLSVWECPRSVCLSAFPSPAAVTLRPLHAGARLEQTAPRAARSRYPRAWLGLEPLSGGIRGSRVRGRRRRGAGSGRSLVPRRTPR